MIKIAGDERYGFFFSFKTFSYAPFQIQLRDYTNRDTLISPELAHVSLSKDDGDGIKLFCTFLFPRCTTTT